MCVCAAEEVVKYECLHFSVCAVLCLSVFCSCPVQKKYYYVQLLNYWGVKKRLTRDDKEVPCDRHKAQECFRLSETWHVPIPRGSQQGNMSWSTTSDCSFWLFDSKQKNKVDWIYCTLLYFVAPFIIQNPIPLKKICSSHRTWFKFCSNRDKWSNIFFLQVNGLHPYLENTMNFISLLVSIHKVPKISTAWLHFDVEEESKIRLKRMKMAAVVDVLLIPLLLIC